MGEIGAAGRAVRAERRRGERGLLVPNVGTARFLPLPAVMASPPTITQGTADAASVISSGVSHAWTSGVFRYLSGTPTVAGVSYPDTLFGRYATVTNPSRSYHMRVEWMHDGQELEVTIKGSGGKYRLFVNDEPATSGWSSAPSATGSIYRMHVDFGSRAVRRVRWECAISGYFAGIVVGPNDSVWKPAMAYGPRVIVLGDSFTEGTGADAALSAWVFHAGQLLGWRDIWPSGVGSTGYVAPGSGGKVKFGDRVSADVIAYSPDIWVLAGGINDVSGLYVGSVESEASALMAALKAGLPLAQGVVLGPWWPSGNPSSTAIQVRDAIEAAADANGIPFIDNIVAETTGSNTLGWMTGTGKVGSTTGSGNADLYTGSDGTHPTQAGHTYLGYRVASAIAELLPL